MNLKNNRAFTLIELMIVIAIIGILAASAVPKFANLINKAKESTAKGNLGAIRSAVTIYYADRLEYPTELDGLVPKNINRLPGAAVPTYTGGGPGEWDDNEFISTTSGEYQDLSIPGVSKGQTDNSVNGGDDGWAYYPADGEVWVETRATDTSGESVHKW
ncbi:MAG: type II secretion system protein [Elusimicrobiota bacterium]|nr:type II secretion system protein [Elusimicrobiota bacterium]